MMSLFIMFCEIILFDINVAPAIGIEHHNTIAQWDQKLCFDNKKNK